MSYFVQFFSCSFRFALFFVLNFIFRFMFVIYFLLFYLISCVACLAYPFIVVFIFPRINHQLLFFLPSRFSNFLCCQQLNGQIVNLDQVPTMIHIITCYAWLLVANKVQLFSLFICFCTLYNILKEISALFFALLLFTKTHVTVDWSSVMMWLSLLKKT